MSDPSDRARAAASLNDFTDPLQATPLDSMPMPKGGLELSYRLRIERDGYHPVELLPHVFSNWAAYVGVQALDTLRLDSLALKVSGMARVAGWSVRDTVHPGGGTIRFADYHIGRAEVTNDEYKKFVDAGGYQRREYWTEPFVRNGRQLSWEEALAEFRDRTGMPGPSRTRSSRSTDACSTTMRYR